MIDPTAPSIHGNDSNPDLITGEPGSHPVGTGVGAAGAGAAGAAIGAAVGGPIGAVVGAVAGAVGGGLAGKGVAESIDPTAEDAFWRENHGSQPYAANGDYEQYQGAYRTGYEGVARHGVDAGYTDVEDDLRSDYETSGHNISMGWDHAKDATRAAFERARGSVKRAV